jgi:hypothetical protein
MKKKKKPDLIIPEDAYKHARSGASVYQISNAYSLPLEVAEKVVRDCASHSDSEAHKMNLQNKIREQVPSAIQTVQMIMTNKDNIVSNDPHVAAIRLKAADTLLKAAARFIDLKTDAVPIEELQPTLFDSVADETGAIELRVVPLLKAVN